MLLCLPLCHRYVYCTAVVQYRSVHSCTALYCTTALNYRSAPLPGSVSIPRLRMLSRLRTAAAPTKQLVCKPASSLRYTEQRHDRQLLKAETYSMTLETWMSTGTLLSLNAVVMKQPKVRAAMTLREKANSELALDRTVFILGFSKYHTDTNSNDSLVPSPAADVQLAQTGNVKLRGINTYFRLRPFKIK